MSGLRFCMLTTFYPPYHFGGDAMGVQRLSHGLVRRGHEVTVIHDVDAFMALHDGPEPTGRPEPEGMTVHRLRASAGRLSTVLTQQMGRPVWHGRRIAKLLDEGRFDVITFHNVSLVGGPGLLRYGDAVKLYMAHEHWLVCPSHVLWRHGRELCTGRECLRCVVSYRRPPQYWRYSGLLEREQRSVDRFIAMSRFSADKHREFGFEPEMDVLPYFLPDDAFEKDDDSAAADSPHPRPYFLFVGRLERIKGLDDVIPLFRDYPDADLLIAGDGTHGAELRELAADIPNVHFLGRLAPTELPRLYAHALALIVPSVCYETFGIILIESFTHRTPVIARRIGPFPEIVEESGGGELFENDRELLDAMRRIQTDTDHREELARSGQEAARRCWSESAVVPRYLDIVRDAAERKGRTHVVDRLMEGAMA